MNEAFDTFLTFPEQERRDVFDAAAERLDTLATYIEKDFWVCRVLDALYHGLPDNHPRLLFKGGTSLSKAFSAIRRFSEDIDVVVFRDDLGFTDDRDPTREGLGRKARERLTNELKEAASHYICTDLAACLSELFEQCKIVEDEEDDDRSTLLVQYPSLYQPESDAYVEPRVKVEGGARSALDPHAIQTVTPYIQEELGEASLVKIPTGAMREGEAVTKSKLEPSKDAPVISRYLKMRAEGISRTRILNDLDLPIAKTSAVGMKWNALTYAGHTVWNVHNEKTKGSGYKGGVKHRPRSEWVIAKNTHDALITTEEAEAILTQIEESSNSRSRRTPASYLSIYLSINRDTQDAER